MSNLQINTRVRRLFYYLEDFEKGLIRIPLFLLVSVWNDKKKLELFDSIKKGRIQVFDPTSTYEKHALWGANK